MPKSEGPKRASAAIEIQHEAAQLAEGQSTRIVCPYCKGGSSGERSLSVTRTHDHRGKFYCFRASCDLGGGYVSLAQYGGGLLSGYTKTNTNVAKTQIKGYVPEPLRDKARKFLKRKYGLTDALIAYAAICSNKDGRVIYTIFGPKRQRRGKVIRRYNNLFDGVHERSTVPKSINVVDDPKNPFISWYFAKRHPKKYTDTLIVVEDVLSALKLNPYFDAVALCGTVFSPDRQMEIKLKRYKTVYLALDNDATRTAAKVVKKNKITIPNLKVKFLHKDIKDFDDTELEEFVESICPGLTESHPSVDSQQPHQRKHLSKASIEPSAERRASC